MNIVLLFVFLAHMLVSVNSNQQLFQVIGKELEQNQNKEHRNKTLGKNDEIEFVELDPIEKIKLPIIDISKEPTENENRMNNIHHSIHSNQDIARKHKGNHQNYMMEKEVKELPEALVYKKIKVLKHHEMEIEKKFNSTETEIQKMKEQLEILQEENMNFKKLYGQDFKPFESNQVNLMQRYEHALKDLETDVTKSKSNMAEKIQQTANKENKSYQELVEKYKKLLNNFENFKKEMPVYINIILN
jgi:hypothetical protein